MKRFIAASLFLIPILSLRAESLTAFRTDTCLIPTAITPNDDGQNDEFVISCIENDRNNESELWIFTEWGERILYAKPYKNSWRGDTKGQPLPDGTYYYIFRLNPKAETQRGFVAIFR
ncbi:MAG: gliding motility-associated C-terminal domain-containing protein [Saprospiraceae bacterium]|nr:gliding motility-associated C-terminal domain-containing protein [Saprospiraceae bacterium]